jgi:NDP-sugar pyrophosphorylase family protein
MKKYKILKNNYIIVYGGDKLYRIQSLRNFNDVKKGNIGGWVQGEHNLSHEGKCWVFGDAMVYGNARVSEYARISGNACISEHAMISGNACISEHAKVGGYAKVWDNVMVYGYATVGGYAKVWDNAKVGGYANVCGRAKIMDKILILSGFISKSMNNFEYSFMMQFGIRFKNDKCILYKRVDKISEGEYSYSLEFSMFRDDIVKFKNNQILKDLYCFNKRSPSEIYLSNIGYCYNKGTLVEFEVNKKDIISINTNLVRVKQCKVIGEVKI